MGIVIHTCNPNAWEAEKVGFPELNGQLSHAPDKGGTLLPKQGDYD